VQDDDPNPLLRPTAGSGALPLLGVLVQVTMLDFIAHVVVEQR
jgi:hypothetical protein